MIKKLLEYVRFADKNIKRRDFLKILGLSLLANGVAFDAYAKKIKVYSASLSNPSDDHIRDYLYKMRHFDSPHRDDIMISRDVYHVFKSMVKRLRRLEELVGHGRFHILGFDDALIFARTYPIVGEFSREELDLMEELYYKDARRYGFFGDKTLPGITDRIKKSEVNYISRHGNYLYRGRPQEMFNKIRRQVGKTVMLTSGVRGVMKQFLLFLNKAYKNHGNLSLSSRSLAPPGYSFHANGDFDVGQVGFGVLNFTERFTTTDAYQSLCELGYLKLRYEIDNPFGVRYEPWHIRIT